MRAAIAGALLMLAGCGAPRAVPVPVTEQLPTPEPSQVQQVVFLVGDPGKARAHSYPILPRLTADIEYWSSQLQADSAVTVLFLGDIVYPLGLHAPGTDLFPHDSAIVMDLVKLTAGPSARARGARSFFLAGNHDYGLKSEYEGFVRLKRLDSFLEMAQAHTGAWVDLKPDAGLGGPYVLDLGDRLRILLLDTAWWVAHGGRLVGDRRDEVLAEIERAMATAGEREVMIAAHHPFKTAGPHGGEFNLWRTFGLQYLLARSGALLQDVNSIPYRELERGMREIFARAGPPLAFVGGHEHSLQVIGATQPTDPTYTIVSGSVSKVSSVGSEEGLQFGLSAPGYMRLVLLRDGSVQLFVEATPPEYSHCPEQEPARERCMAEGIAAFRTVHSQRLR